MRSFYPAVGMLHESARKAPSKSQHQSLREKNMKITERKPMQKAEDLLTTVARSIGSTLGAVAAKVNATTRPSRRRRTAGRTRTRKHASASRNSRRASAAVSKRSNKVARLIKKNRKKSSK
jgi:hypothetical protein